MSKATDFTVFVVSLVIVLVGSVSLAAFAADAPAAPAAPPAAAAPAAPAAPNAPAAAPAVPPRAGGREGRLSPEASNTAWELEAKTVARQLKLDDAKTAELVKTYKEARAAYRKALEEKLGTQEKSGRESFEAMREVAKGERTKLEAALGKFLTPDQTKQAMASLGSFNTGWDRMASVLSGMKLDPKVEGQAMDLTVAYVSEMTAAMQAGATDMREKAQAAREKLNGEIAKLLTPDQLTKWQQATERRRRPQ